MHFGGVLVTALFKLAVGPDQTQRDPTPQQLNWRTAFMRRWYMNMVQAWLKAYLPAGALQREGAREVPRGKTETLFPKRKCVKDVAQKCRSAAVPTPYCIRYRLTLPVLARPRGTQARPRFGIALQTNGVCQEKAHAGRFFITQDVGTHRKDGGLFETRMTPVLTT